ncbi:fimbrial protein [Serratia rubidaea]|uniref:Fimbrial protein n=1 Tax=Serratia rubidaea TaxID=61652 RepID=A0ABS0MBB5_SERRU|nr:fimbrial protein [Serratia rubidaea]MBH1929653.1 fimbrial protein [Serratia rubidaea]
MRWRALLALLLFWGAAHAEPDNTCWGDPVNIAVVDIANAPFTSNKKGSSATVKYRTNPTSFSGFCNKSILFASMTHYIDMGPALTPSNINPGYFKLSDDVDVMIGSSADNVMKFFPLEPPDSLVGRNTPIYIGKNVFTTGFGVAGEGEIKIKLRRDIIGGAILVPSDTELFSAYRVMNQKPYPPRPSKPMVQARTKGGGQIIPVTPECSINQGNVIEANFHTLQTDQVASRSDGERYSKDIALHFSCNTSLTQDIKVQLMADSAGFSSDLIRSDNNALGIVLKHQGQLVKPMMAFPARLEEGSGNENITLTPVKDPKVALQAGTFNASATLVILSQ